MRRLTILASLMLLFAVPILAGEQVFPGGGEGEKPNIFAMISAGSDSQAESNNVWLTVGSQRGKIGASVSAQDSTDTVDAFGADLSYNFLKGNTVTPYLSVGLF